MTAETNPEPQSVRPGAEENLHLHSKGRRVCHIAATTEGAVWVFEQLRDLRDRFGYDISIILNGTSGTLVNRFKAAGIRVLASDFQFLGRGDLLAVPRKILELAQLLRRERFDIVQTHLFHSMVIGRIAAWLADVPVRLSMIAGPFHLEAYTPRWIDASTQWMDIAIIPSCEFSRELYLEMGVRKDRLDVIYYGPDETKFDPANHTELDLRGEYGFAPDEPLIGMVAYFYPELGYNRWTPPAVQGRAVKCQADLIQAMPRLLEEFPRAKLLLVGSGWEAGGQEYLKKMQLLVAELGLSESVVFTGYKTNIPGVLKALDVAVQASLSENLGGSIEALLMECPTVATSVGGLVDSVIDGHTGVLVAPGEPAELARGILTLLRDPAGARDLGRRGRQLMLEKFTLHQTVEREHRLYQTLAQRSPRGFRRSRRLLRLLGGAIVGAYMATRYTVFDANILPAWDAGWRPWHFVRLRWLIARMLNFLLGRSVPIAATPELESDAEDADAALRGDAANEQFVSVRIHRPPPMLPIIPRMMLYRFYAFVGRQRLGWGLRAGIRTKLKRLFAIGTGSADQRDRQ